MKLEKIWAKLERGEPLTTREDKTFTDGLMRGMDALIEALNAKA